MKSPYLVSAGKVIDFGTPYYFNLALEEVEAYTFKLFESNISTVGEVHLTVSVTTDVNAMVIVETDNQMDTDLYLGLKEGEHSYVLPLNKPVKVISLLIQAINNGKIETAKIVISNFTIC